VKKKLNYVLVFADNKTVIGASQHSSCSQQASEENIEMQAENIDKQNSPES